jgi:hypothetical protein
VDAQGAGLDVKLNGVGGAHGKFTGARVRRQRDRKKHQRKFHECVPPPQIPLFSELKIADSTVGHKPFAM